MNDTTQIGANDMFDKFIDWISWFPSGIMFTLLISGAFALIGLFFAAISLFILAPAAIKALAAWVVYAWCWAILHGGDE